MQSISNKSWRQHATKQQLYSHLPPIRKTIKTRRTRHAGHCWRSWDELISHVLLWTPSHGRAKAGRLARSYIEQLCVDTECSPEYRPEAMDDREEWRERVRDISADGVTWWLWWWFVYLYIYLYRLFVAEMLFIRELLYTITWYPIFLSSIITLNALILFQGF